MKLRYRLRSANQHCYVFEVVGLKDREKTWDTADYVIPKVTWARWCRGDYP